ncbi:hypothetical protein GCM10011351_01940 [Paraliobacillus quinghaiensis]|uniref:DUF1659 domain-containing protein n=1 Tax=Paraliobacillus quinghaiensis TaxID=470815 RepID=A0A917TDP8_9BACI|nr:DUF1659 domain-containing protein [Paraliobacillus quinghaiensis]GGM19695.1 hypothetical protein GCM10011351_01940 [Paraliobacillus quinghaiensis]
MAVTETIDSRLQLLFESGYDEVNGKTLITTKSFNNVKTDATSEQLLAIADALVPLQTLPLHMIKRNDTELITA